MLEYIDQSGGKQYPFTTEGRVLRVATVEDLNDQSRIDSEKTRYIKAARDVIRELDLPMKLVEVEQLISRDRIVFYFTSENRIDFRELVRRLAGEFHVRVEMRQVGARDEARLVADYERCGQHCCCKQFLKVLKPVSMRSAKVQKATLDPTKISGRCGRLMCCLRYEDETYEALRKKLPKRNARVMTDDGPGTVMNSQILTQLVLVELDQGRKRQAYPVENIERIPADGRPPQQPKKPDDSGEPRGRRPEPSRPKPGRPLRDEQVESAEGAPAADVSEPQSPAPQADASPPTDEPAEGQRKKRRRRRRRKKRGGGAPGNEDGAPGSGDNPNPSAGPPPSDN
jgi:cell fate regulator YaaT (PSP1 superfamily)